MPTIEINDEQILRCLDQLSPEGKKTALRQLLGGWSVLTASLRRIANGLMPSVRPVGWISGG